MKIVESELKSINEIARCHIKAFPTSVSSRLGKLFCKKMMKWFVLNERGVLFHAEDEQGIVVGYVSLMIKTAPGQSGSFSTISQYAFRELLLLMLLRPWLVFHPLFRSNYKTIRKIVLQKLKIQKPTKSSHKSKQSIVKVNFTPQIGIVGIGVDPKHQCKGYGSALIKQCVEYCKSNGFCTLDLSVHKDNAQAIAAYKKNGFKIIKIKEDCDICMTLEIK